MLPHNPHPPPNKSPMNLFFPAPAVLAFIATWLLIGCGQKTHKLSELLQSDSNFTKIPDTSLVKEIIKDSVSFLADSPRKIEWMSDSINLDDIQYVQAIEKIDSYRDGIL